MTSNNRENLSGLFTALALVATGCVGEVPEGVADEDVATALAGTPDVPPRYLDQGWSAETRAAFYQTTQGSRMLPYGWFVKLEEAGSRQKFNTPSNMRRMGFLVDGRTATNPDNVPVGFAKDVDLASGDQIGLTCAACHTGELEYNGTRVRIDGGQSFGDIEQLQNGMLAALDATLADSAKFGRFATALGASDQAALRAEMVTERDWLSRRITRSKGLTPHGPSRTDAFTIIGNEVVCDLFGVAANCALAVAPTQYPFLWGTPDFEWAQYNSSVHSPLGRNVGEVTGVFAEATLSPSGIADSSANLENLHALEGWLKQLQSPAWPEDVLGAINPTLAAQGEALFAANCASCHPHEAPTVTNVYGRTMKQMNFATPLGALGTDPTAAISFATRRANPGPWTGLATALGLVGPDGKASVAALLSVSGSTIIQKFFAVNGFTDLQKLSYLDFRQSRTPTTAQLVTYKARPLDGIALTAPFLHNGSVSSMYELLLPPAQRAKSFYVGNQSYDPVKLGYSTEVVAGAVLLDTTATGNGNGGHVYGTTLTDADRYALIEYLKTL